jgi:hypothetical protein
MVLGLKTQNEARASSIWGKSDFEMVAGVGFEPTTSGLSVVEEEGK